jgi:hypothetical protein
MLVQKTAKIKLNYENTHQTTMTGIRATLDASSCYDISFRFAVKVTVSRQTIFTCT